MTTRLVRSFTPLAVAAFGISAATLVLPACDSTPSDRESAGSTGGDASAVMESDTPEGLLASLKAAARQSLPGYYDALRAATDCDALPEMCRLLSARAESARELIALRNAMVEKYGDEGEAAGAEMLRGAFLEEYEAIERASVFAGSGTIAILRIGTAVYRMRDLPTGWRIVQFPDPPYDPAASADAIDIVVVRARGIRRDIERGRIPTLQDLELRLAGLAGG